MTYDHRKKLDPDGDYINSAGEYLCLECGMTVVDKDEMLCSECNCIYDQILKAEFGI
jgi:DNA-directed RNA polymerase subunit RPC12/RpoP